MRRHGLDAKKLMMLMGGGEETPFVDPTSISGLLLWCAADELTGLNDGDAVASFTDLSGNGNHPVCANAANKPTYKTNIINSLPALLFDGSQDANGDWLRVGFNRAIPNTVFIVFQMLTLRTSSYVLAGYTSSPNRMAISTTNSNLLKALSSTALEYANAGADSFAIWTVEFNGATSKIYKAGSLVKEGNTGTSVENGLTIGASPYFVLNGADGTRELTNAHMYLAEVIIYNSVLSETQRNNVGNFLEAKYGLNF